MSHRRRPYKPLETAITVKPNLGGKGVVYALWGIFGFFAVALVALIATTPTTL